MSFKVVPVTSEQIGFGEAPIWDEERQKLIFVSCFDKAICIFDPKARVLDKKIVPNFDEDSIIAALPCQDENSDMGMGAGREEINPNFLVVGGDKLLKFNWNTEQTEIIFQFELQKLGKRSFCDGKFDAKGRFWTGAYIMVPKSEIFSESSDLNQGEIYRFSRNQETGLIEKVRQAGGFEFSNGLAWNKENTKLYYSDLMKRVINIYDFDLEKGQIGNPTILYDFNKMVNLKGLPNGMVADAYGNLCVACWKGGCVIKIDGNTGQLLEKFNMPIENTTSLCFGGDDYKTLFVTTTAVEMDQSPVKYTDEQKKAGWSELDAGKIFQITNPLDNTFKGFKPSKGNF